MAYQTKQEKRAWRKGLLAGLRKAKKASSAKKNWKKKRIYNNSTVTVAKKRSTSKVPPPGVYGTMGRINENLVDDRSGPVVFWDDFEYDSRGRIKGEWIDGKFIPD